MPLKHLPNSVGKIVSGNVAFSMIDGSGHPRLCGVSRVTLTSLSNLGVITDEQALEAFDRHRWQIEAAASQNYDAGMGCLVGPRDV